MTDEGDRGARIQIADPAVVARVDAHHVDPGDDDPGAAASRRRRAPGSASSNASAERRASAVRRGGRPRRRSSTYSSPSAPSRPPRRRRARRAGRRAALSGADAGRAPRSRRCSSRRTRTGRRRSAIAVPRYDAPPLTEQPPRRGCTRSTGRRVPVGGWSSLNRSLPSNALHPKLDAPTGAGPSAARRRVDLLELVLADVGDPEVAGDRVEREPPRVAQPERPDLARAAPSTPTNGLSAGTVYGRSPDGVGSMRRILPSSVPRSSARRSGSPPEPPSPSADVEHAVGPERQIAAVVVGVRLVDADQHPRPTPRSNVPSADDGVLGDRPCRRRCRCS